MPWALLLNPRFVVILIVFLTILGTSLYIWYLKNALERSRADAALSQALYEENIQQFEALKEVRKQEMLVLQQRETRLQQDRIKAEKRLQEILKHDSSKDCPLSDSINDLLNGLSNPESQDTDSKNQPTP